MIAGHEKSNGEWFGERLDPGETRNLDLSLVERYSGGTVAIPIHIKRGTEPGPAVFVCGAMHGDELNGTGAIRHLILDSAFQVTRGTLILVPVVNVLAFERHSRYLPDRRDLNRCFPGSATGSLASRYAHTFFTEVVERCDYGIDLHTASIRRTNFPNVRGDLSDPGVQRLVDAFGAEFSLDGLGPQGTLRREATRRGCPTIVFEAGEVWKVEPAIVAYTVQCIRNALAGLGMLDAERSTPHFRVTITKTKWIRAERGGFLKFHVAPGEIVESGAPLATNTNLLGEEQHLLTAPFASVVIGMTTLPAVTPGEPVCNLGRISADQIDALRRARSVRSAQPLAQIRTDLASNVLVEERGAE